MKFETTSPLGYVVVYNDYGEAHTKKRHPEMIGRTTEIRRVIEDPGVIYKSKDFPDTRHVYFELNAHPQFPNFFLAVVVEIDPKPAAVVTSYPQPYIHGVQEGGLIYVRGKR